MDHQLQKRRENARRMSELVHNVAIVGGGVAEETQEVGDVVGGSSLASRLEQLPASQVSQAPCFYTTNM